MKLFVAFCLILLTIGVDCEDCTAVTCPAIPKHYEEYGCIPKIEAGKCCPSQ
jgi:hypothetical protein